MNGIFITKNSAETREIASDFARRISHSQYAKKAAVIGLIGELGSGKTVFAKGFAEGLGVKGVITSPTFVLEKVYELPAKTHRHFIHIDAYRIEKPKELTDLGFKDLIRDSKNIILIEWADRIKNILPRNCIKIKFEHFDKNRRKIKIENL